MKSCPIAHITWSLKLSDSLKIPIEIGSGKSLPFSESIHLKLRANLSSYIILTFPIIIRTTWNIYPHINYTLHMTKYCFNNKVLDETGNVAKLSPCQPANHQLGAEIALFSN